MRRILFLMPLVLLGLLGGGAAARAEPLVADLSNHLIAITTGFNGADVLLFGATDGPGDIVAVVRGPTGRAIVRQKGRLFGIWVNRSSMDFDEVPNRKSTRLNSSHPSISYAVFCLKKKTKT